MKTLRLTFLNTQGQKVVLSPKNAVDHLSTARVLPVMELICQSGLFSKDDKNPYHEIFGAKYVEVIETDIFAIH